MNGAERSAENLSEGVGSERHAPGMAERARLRRRVGFVAVGVLVVAVLALTPPLVNLERYRRKIALTMSQSLGRPVHIDRATLHVLPMPGLTLGNLVVSEDPAFGNEPTIRANTVEATLRVSSLWRRRVEFSTIRFVDPSVNLVRNPAGKWNLEAVLMQASHVETAPTAQRRPGPAPRFPYIEATGARINLKLGLEKMPFSFTDTEFALWLPSPQQWRVRLAGRPTRTDANVSDTGLMRLEATLSRANSASAVPVELRASWTGAQLGEATRLVLGRDAGWRGTGAVELAVTGPLAAAKVQARVSVNELRREDFVPARLLEFRVNCTAVANLPQVVATGVHCGIPLESGGVLRSLTLGNQPAAADPVSLDAVRVDLQRPAEGAATVQVSALPLNWALEWVRLVSPRTPGTVSSSGVADGRLDWDPVARAWTGTVTAMLPPVSVEDPAAGKDAAAGSANAAAVDGIRLPFSLRLQNVSVQDAATAKPGSGLGSTATLTPTLVRLAQGSTVTVGGEADRVGYALSLSGTASADALKMLVAALPPVGEALPAALGKDSAAGSSATAQGGPTSAPASATPADGASAARPVNVACLRLWGAAEECSAIPAAEPLRPSGHKASRRR